jgi:hypothetical protein
MRFYTKQHQFYCGIDLHAHRMYVRILDQTGEILLHQNMKAGPEAFLRAITLYRADIVVARRVSLYLVLARRPLRS